MLNVKSIEDCIELLVFSAEFTVQKSDMNITSSIARQVKKGIALTDRQFALMQTKLLEYKDQFANKDICIDDYIDTLRMPLREIDRSHWLKINDGKLQIRFPFRKKIIDRIEELRRISLSDHSYANHTHTFPLNERYVYELVNIAKRFDTKFDIDQDIIDIYAKLEEFTNNRENYIPGIYNNQIKNIPDNAIKLLKEDCGDIEENIALYYDRRHLFGLYHFDNTQIDNALFGLGPLTQNIVRRQQPNVFVNDKKYNVHSLVQTITELKRYPMIVILSTKDCASTLPNFFEAINGVIPAEDQCVLFRLENIDAESKDFNQYIKDKKLNNSVAKNTKVVYISSNKVPKPLLVSGFKPKLCLTFSQFGPTERSKNFVENLDLLIHYYDEQSIIDRYTRKNFEIV